MSADPTPPYSTAEVGEIYDGLARWWGVEGFVCDFVVATRAPRRRLMSQATGVVLDVACGTGENFASFRDATSLTAVDLSAAMLERARRRAEKLTMPVTLVKATADALPFPDHHFDTVASALSTCVFPDSVVALGEMRRVVKPGGSVLLFEHGLSSTEWVARFQHRRAAKHYRGTGCTWTRDPLANARAAGLDVRSAQRMRLGMFYAIEAAG